MASLFLRNEALLMLEGKGTILDVEANHLNGRFTPKIAKAFRKEFRELLKRLASER